MVKNFLFCLLFFGLFQVISAKDRVYSSFLKVAINGYDSVAYFLDARPVQGDSAFSYEWQGAKWKFANQKNLELFKKNPEKYAPQYGGFCAYAMSKGVFASSIPESWSIVDEKLYLNYDLELRKKWLANKTYFIQFADRKWQDIWQLK